ncbi:MAG TPA: SRPBCC family protein [Ktedonobacterales bacterium]|nr:SRPBCC family protein [Ktedonobacterales bacterium]
MSQIHVEAERIVNARPEDAFRFLANYRDRRPTILTKDYSNYQVVKGGSGAGTVFTYTFHTARGDRPYEMRVEEPAKNTLLERDTRSSLTTTWRVAPAGDSSQSRVSIVTEWAGASGIGGFFERTFAPASLKRTYMAILDRLNEVVASSGTGRAAG